MIKYASPWEFVLDRVETKMHFCERATGQWVYWIYTRPAALLLLYTLYIPACIHIPFKHTPAVSFSQPRKKQT